MEHYVRIRTFPFVDDRSGVGWELWVEQNNQGQRLNRLWSGWVPFQDDVVATAYLVLQDALKELEVALSTFDRQEALPFE